MKRKGQTQRDEYRLYAQEKQQLWDNDEAHDRELTLYG